MKVIKFFVVAILVSSLISCNSKNYSKESLKTEIDSVSYAIGMDMALKLKKDFSEVNVDLYRQGYQAGMDSVNQLLKGDDLMIIITDYFRKKRNEERKLKQAESLAKAEIEYADVKKIGEEFIEENKSKKGVKITDSGLQYIVLKEGKGENPKRTDRVKVHYHGTLADGTVFDSSVDRGKPYETGVGQVIPGWVEGLQLMNVGSKYKFFIPQELAYGATPRSGGVIKPFAPLVFEVELLEIK